MAAESCRMAVEMAEAREWRAELCRRRMNEFALAESIVGPDGATPTCRLPQGVEHRRGALSVGRGGGRLLAAQEVRRSRACSSAAQRSATAAAVAATASSATAQEDSTQQTNKQTNKAAAMDRYGRVRSAVEPSPPKPRCHQWSTARSIASALNVIAFVRIRCAVLCCAVQFDAPVGGSRPRARAAACGIGWAQRREYRAECRRVQARQAPLAAHAGRLSLSAPTQASNAAQQ
jgi:hypothetical protein